MLTYIRQTATADFYKRLAIIAIPSTLQFLLTSSRQLVDTFMIGQLGEVPVAAVGAAARPFFVVIMVLWGASHGTGMLASQYWGKKDIIGVRKSVVQAVLLSLMVVLPAYIIFRFFPEYVIRLVTSDPEIILQGKTYLSIVSSNMLALSVTFPVYAGLRSINQAYTCTVISTFGVVFNIVANYLLIFGYFGFPQLGLQGAAIGTMLSAILESAIAVCYIYFTDHTLAVKAKALREALRADQFKKFFDITFPVIVNGLVWSAGTYIYFIIYGHMGKQELAVMTMFTPLESFCIAFFGGVSTGAAVMLGHHLGRKDFGIAWKESWLFVIIGFLVSLVLSAVLMLLRDSLLGLFDGSMTAQTLALARDAYPILLIGLMSKAINIVVINGVLRSGADTKFILKLDMGCQWLVGIPLGLLGAFVWNLPLKGVFALVCGEEVVKIFICTARMYSRVWIRNLVDEPEKLTVVRERVSEVGVVGE